MQLSAFFIHRLAPFRWVDMAVFIHPVPKPARSQPFTDVSLETGQERILTLSIKLLCYKLPLIDLQSFMFFKVGSNLRVA